MVGKTDNLLVGKTDSDLMVGKTDSDLAADYQQNGFIPVVVEDACGDRDDRVHRANIFDLANKYADVVSSVEVLDYLQER